jgi:CHAT domain-containing protein/Tfp pilus assembly protein PilF
MRSGSKLGRASSEATSVATMRLRSINRMKLVLGLAVGHSLLLGTPTFSNASGYTVSRSYQALIDNVTHSGASSAAFGRQAQSHLEPSKSFERELASGRLHTYSVALLPGQYLRVVAEQRGISVALALRCPQARCSGEMTGSFGAQGPLSISMIADLAGDYTVEVRASEPDAKSGLYEIRIEELRQAVYQDRLRVEAERAFAQASRLSRETPAKSRQASVQKYLDALSRWRDLGDTLEQARTLYSIGEAQRSLGQFQDAIVNYDQAIQLQRSLGDRRGEAYSLNGVAYCNHTLGNLDVALHYYEESLRNRESQNDLINVASSLNNIAGVYAVRGDPLRSLEYYNRALEMRLSIDDRAGAARTRLGLAYVFQSVGESQKALEAYELALPVLRGSDLNREALALNGIGYCYASLGDTKSALEYYSEALPIQERTGNHGERAGTLNNVGNAYVQVGEQRKALEYFEQALTAHAKISDEWRSAYTMINAGAAHVSLGEGDKANDYYVRALAILRRVGDRRGEATALDSTARALAAQGRESDASRLYGQALSIWQAIKDRRGEAATRVGFARLERARGNLLRADASMDNALKTLEDLRTDLSNQQLRASFFASVRDAYETAIDIKMQLGGREPSAAHVGSALQLSETARARILVDVLRRAGANITKGADSALLGRERYLRQELDAKGERLTQLLGSDKTRGQAGAVENEIESLGASHVEVQKQIKASSPGYAALMLPHSPDLRQIQDLIDRDTLLLEYLLGDERSYLWAVTSSEMKAYQLPGRKEVESAVRGVYDLLAGESAGRSASTWSANYAKAAARLSEILLEPVASQLGKKRLLVVPEGALQFLPFSALPEPASLRNGGRTPVPMVVKHEVIDLPSAGALAALRNEIAQRRRAEKTIAVLANPVFDKDDYRVKAPEAAVASNDKQTTVAVPESTAHAKGLSDLRRALRGVTPGVDESRLPPLPSSKDEADAIGKLVPDGQALIATDFNANRAMATGSELSQYRIIHFATHALLNTEHPELSGIVLSMVDERGQPQNGFLRLGDIYNLKLPAELVVLSACDTALGKDIKGEGLIGLTRGFMYAGAARVISSLWKVDDEASAELMRRFYQKMLKEAERPAAALRSAQVEMLNTRRWSSPRHWAGFILQGEWK